MSKLDRVARSVPGTRTIADELEKRGVSLALGKQVYDPNDPMGRMFFNILATFAEFENELIRLRTREGMKIARDKGKLRGKAADEFDHACLIGFDREDRQDLRLRQRLLRLDPPTARRAPRQARL